jgi:hypothetical protein
MGVDDLPGADDPSGLMNIMDVVQQASLTMAINDCWLLLGAVALVALPVLIILGPIRSALPIAKLAQDAHPVPSVTT